MNEDTRAFMEVAYNALQKAYYCEVGFYREDVKNDFDKESAKKIGEALKKVGDILRGDA